MRLLLLAAGCLQLAAQTFTLGTAADPCTGGTPWTLVPTTPPAAFPTNRYDAVGFTCTFAGDKGPGVYSVLLEFVEANVSSAGARVFDVFANDTPILGSFDIFASGGTDPSKVVTRTSAICSTDGKITLRLHTIVRSAVLYRVTLTAIRPTSATHGPFRLWGSIGPAPTDTVDYLGVTQDFVIYIDAADNKVKVRRLDGTITILGPQ